MTADWLYFVADIVLITFLVLVLYRRRHGRKDLVIALIGSNIGVMVVAAALHDISSAASMGVGLGLFGVLSIIRLRSTELEHYDVAYYFSALAMGLIAGLGVGTLWMACILMALPMIALGIVDSPLLMPGSRRQRITLDHAITDEAALRAELSRVLNAEVTHITVLHTDLIQDKTVVDVVCRVRSGAVDSGARENLTARAS